MLAAAAVEEDIDDNDDVWGCKARMEEESFGLLFGVVAVDFAYKQLPVKFTGPAARSAWSNESAANSAESIVGLPTIWAKYKTVFLYVQETCIYKE